MWPEEALRALALATHPLAISGGPQVGPCFETAQNALVGAAFCKGKLGSGNKPQPQCGLAQDPSTCLLLT